MSSISDSCKRLFGELCAIVAYGGAGALLAGGYGILHDQITFSISREYFTDFKFNQFAWAVTSLPERAFVAEIGFLATWWVGALAGAALAAIAIFRWGFPVPVRKMGQGFAAVAICAITAGTAGGILGYFRRADPDFNSWRGFSELCGVRDLPAFVNVGYIHNGSYLGAAVGFVVALCLIIRRGKSTAPGQVNGDSE